MLRIWRVIEDTVHTLVISETYQDALNQALKLTSRNDETNFEISVRTVDATDEIEIHYDSDIDADTNQDYPFLAEDESSSEKLGAEWIKLLGPGILAVMNDSPCSPEYGIYYRYAWKTSRPN